MPTSPLRICVMRVRTVHSATSLYLTLHAFSPPSSLFHVTSCSPFCAPVNTLRRPAISVHHASVAAASFNPVSASAGWILEPRHLHAELVRRSMSPSSPSKCASGLCRATWANVSCYSRIGLLCHHLLRRDHQHADQPAVYVARSQGHPQLFAPWTRSGLPGRLWRISDSRDGELPLPLDPQM
jgi:hypothetical protein